MKSNNYEVTGRMNIGANGDIFVGYGESISLYEAGTFSDEGMAGKFVVYDDNRVLLQITTGNQLYFRNGTVYIHLRDTDTMLPMSELSSTSKYRWELWISNPNDRRNERFDHGRLIIHKTERVL